MRVDFVSLLLVSVIWASTLQQPGTARKEKAEDGDVTNRSKRAFKRNHTGPRIQAGTERTVRIDDEPEEVPQSLEWAVEQAASIKSQAYPKADPPNYVGLRSKRLGPNSRAVPKNSAGTQSSTFYPGGEKMLTDRDAQKDRLSDPTDQMSEAEKQQALREIQLMQQKLEEMKQKAGIVSPPSPTKGFTSSAAIGGQTSRSNNSMGRSGQKTSLPKTGIPMTQANLLSKPGVTVHHETIIDEHQNKVILTTVTQETPRGMKTSRYYSPVGNTSALKSSAGIPQAITSSMASLSRPAQSSQQGRTYRSDNRSSLMKPKYTTDKGYPLLTTDEMPFPHVFQAQVAPWSGARKSQIGPNLAKSTGVPLKIDIFTSSSGGDSSISDLTKSDESVEKKPAEETGGKISSRLVPDTFRRLAETTGLRREQSGKGGKGFLESTKHSSTTIPIKDDELKEVIVDGDDGKKGKSAVGGSVGKKTKTTVGVEDEKKGKGEAGQDQSGNDDLSQDKITGDLDNGTDGPKKMIDGGDQPKGKRRRRSHEKKPHTNEHQGKGEKSDRPQRRRRHREKGDADDEDKPGGKPNLRNSQDDQPASAKHGADGGHTQQRAVIIDDHDESDSYDDDHICKKLQPLLRYVEYEYVINTSTGFANVFALLMSLLSKLGAFG